MPISLQSATLMDNVNSFLKMLKQAPFFIVKQSIDSKQNCKYKIIQNSNPNATTPLLLFSVYKLISWITHMLDIDIRLGYPFLVQTQF